MEKLPLNLISNIKNSNMPRFSNSKNAAQNHMSLSFTSKHIMDVNLKRRTTKKPIGAQIAKLDFSK